MTERVDAGSSPETETRSVSLIDYPKTTVAIDALKSQESNRIFLEIFRDSVNIRALEKTREFLGKQPAENKVQYFRSALAGYFFEQFAWRLAELRLPGILGKSPESTTSQKVLSPAQTFELLHAAFPENEVCDASMGLGQTLGGFKIPDGLFIECQGRWINKKTTIQGICEYTLQPIINPFGNGTKRRQLRVHESFDVIREMLKTREKQIVVGQRLHSNYPNFPPKLLVGFKDLIFIYVRPRVESDMDDVRLFRNSVHIFPSFGRSQFYRVVDGIIEDSRLSTN